MSPGGGRDYTYSPVGVNATLNCKVANNDLTWSINNIGFDRPNEIIFFARREIFQSELLPSPDGLSSSVFVFGNISNNASMICCQPFLEARQMISCTSLIIYGKLIFLSVKTRVVWSSFEANSKVPLYSGFQYLFW